MLISLHKGYLVICSTVREVLCVRVELVSNACLNQTKK